ncbi:MAG TPA: ferredoxin--NADP reductase [Actinoplanes sp.]|nr:ferredoxin--NADP reductase [Actinoplanes sp.]
MAGFRPMRVARVIVETAEASSLVLDEDLDYLPGQYLTVRTPAGVRCYSLASAPGTGEPPKITVKRMAGGLVSNWICDRVRAGDVVDMAGPAGTFTPRSLDDELLLLAGGSGITPIMGIVKSMRRPPVLLYANRDVESMIFRDELDGLLPVIHWLDRERGVPTADVLSELLHPYREREAFVCGPEAFVAVAEKALQIAGVPTNRIRIERFEPDPAAEGGPDTDGTSDRAAESGGGRDAIAEVEIDGRSHVLPWAAGRRLLDVIVDAGLNPPWSCRQGQCGACTVRLVSGEVELIHNEILEEEDFAEGYTLACQAVAVSEHVKVTYQ